MPVSASVSSNTAKSTKQYVCNVCGKSFDSAETLSSHQRFEHSEPGSFKTTCRSRLIYAATAIPLDESMPTAYVLINYDIGTEEKFIDKLKNVPGVMEVNEVNGVYDIVAKIASDTLGSLNETITRHIKIIDTIRSTMTLIVIE
jgi:DNA-binding Lrp family transcriptional regulator